MNLPTVPDAERFVLASILMEPSHMDDARKKLDISDFSEERHRRIWKYLCQLYDTREPIGVDTLYLAMQKAGDHEIAPLSYLIDMDLGLPQLSNIDAYVQKVTDTSMRRRILVSFRQIAARAADLSDPLPQIIEQFEKNISDLVDESVRGAELISTRQLLETLGIEKLLGPRIMSGLQIPWPTLNKSLCGLQPGQLIVLLAETMRGKTSFALQIATKAALHSTSPLIWTLEMSPYSMYRRLVAQISGVAPEHRPNELTFQERDSQREAVVRLNDCPVWFDTTSDSVAAFIASMRKFRRQNRFGLAVVDYLQLIRSDGNRNRAEEVSDNSRSLKKAAMDLQIPILVLSQVDRASVKGDGEIGLHSAKNSGDIENDADVLLWIQGKEFSRDEPTDVKLHVGKQREGPAGFNVPMRFHPNTQTFQEFGD